MENLVVLGHSFVRRLGHYAERRGGGFGLENYSVSFFFRGGGVIQDMYTFLPNLCRVAPKYVFLQIGGNDIFSGCVPQQVARDIVDMAEVIWKETGAAVIIGSIFPRTNPRNVSRQDYEDLRREINFWCDVFSSRSLLPVRYWRHNRLRGWRHFRADGVHLATDHDQEMFLRSIRGAFLWCILSGFRLT